MNIATALKKRKRLAGEIAELETRIKSHNVSIIGSTQAFDVKSLKNDLDSRRAEIIRLKTQIQKANGPILEKIIELAELKGDLTFVNTLEFGAFNGDRLRSSSVNPVSGAITEVKDRAQIPLQDIISEKARLSNRIEQLQDEIDVFNGTTQVV